jgi:hypothetical protein
MHAGSEAGTETRTKAGTVSFELEMTHLLQVIGQGFRLFQLLVKLEG